ncbi:MAG: TetR/AcrR family transcriptional regulator [Cellvibrionaceae bacterium]
MTSDQLPPLGLREQRKAETRAKIVEAAISCFSELGFNGASTRDIAKKAGVGQGLISYHFDSKEALWQEAVEQIFLKAQMPVIAKPDQNMDRDQLRQAFVDSLHGYALHCVNSPDLAMLLYHEAGQNSQRLGWLIEHHLIPAMLRLKPMHELASREGILRDIPFNVFAFSLTGVINTHFSLHQIYHSVTGDDPCEETIGRELINHISNMFLLQPI